MYGIVADMCTMSDPNVNCYRFHMYMDGLGLDIGENQQPYAPNVLKQPYPTISPTACAGVALLVD